VPFLSVEKCTDNSKRQATQKATWDAGVAVRAPVPYPLAQIHKKRKKENDPLPTACNKTHSTCSSNTVTVDNLPYPSIFS
jgi:hypothetical protein